MPLKSIILIPGYNFKASIWSSILSNLQGFHIHLLDFPRVSNFNIEEVSTTTGNNIPDNSIIVGWSLGGLIAIYLSEFMPQKCKKLVLVSSTPRFMEDSKWPGITFDQIKNTSNIFNRLVQYPNKLISIRTYLKEHAKDSDEGYLSLVKNLDARSIYPKISIPVLNIQGDQDAIIPINQIRCFSQFHKTIIISHAGHIPFLTHPHIFINELMKFIKS